MAEREKRSEIFDFLVRYIDSHGYGPSVREICDAVDLRSTATVHYHLRQLAEQGMIRIGDGKKRAISLVKSQQEPLPPSEGPGFIPILGTVAAGQPILALEQIDGYLPWPGGADWFALRVKGESMKNPGSSPGIW